jgi:folate-dependent phosphoribosylglycinamide formyltransferase PurN
MNKKRIIVLFSGSASSLRYLFANDENYGKLYEVVGGISSKKDTAGEAFCKEKGIPFVELNAKRFCTQHGYDGKLKDMPIDIRKSYFEEMLRIISPFEPDLILLSGFMLEIKGALLGYRPIINVHPSDMRIKNAEGKPKYTGDDTVTMAINDGQSSTVSTIHFVEEEVDCGKIICVSKPLTVEKGTTAKEHQERMKTLCDGPAYKEALQILCLN